MKTPDRVAKLLELGSLLALAFSFTAPVSLAGPPPQFWVRPTTLPSTKDTPKTAPVADANAMACPACKTTDVRASRHVGPLSKGSDEWSTVGVKHTCSHCGGEIKTVRGVTTNTMTPNCDMCGKDAAPCKAAVRIAATKA